MARNMSLIIWLRARGLSRDRVVQRRWLNLGELNTTQIDRWQRSIEVALNPRGASVPDIR
jgi:hypothetical protein